MWLSAIGNPGAYGASSPYPLPPLLIHHCMICPLGLFLYAGYHWHVRSLLRSLTDSLTHARMHARTACACSTDAGTRIFERNHTLLQRNCQLLKDFFAKWHEHFSWCEPIAATTAFARIKLDPEAAAEGLVGGEIAAECATNWGNATSFVI